MPGPPDAGFFGRDETLLALDRAFDTQQMVLLHAFAGAGKSSTAAEFARWYHTTGGLDHPELGPGPVLWSSFEHHLPVDRLLDTAGDCFSELLEANGIPWQAVTSPARRRDLVMQVLAQVPVLWVWDNIEPVTGFPPGTPSPWTQAEQDDLEGFLRDLATQSRCKVLLTSRRDERAWLAGLPARVRLPPMPMRERLQLATALAERHGQVPARADWRPLLRYTAGNPLTITVLVGQALREGLTTTSQIQAFVEQLHAGEAELEPGEDTALGRTRSLAASLSYGFTHAFTGAERGQLAVLHLFRDTIDAEALRAMGDPEFAVGDAVPQLAGLTREAAVALLDRAAGIGLLSPLGGGYYAIHPALPWYFTTLFTAAYGSPASPAAHQAARAYTHTLAWLGDDYFGQDADGAGDPVPALGAEEANLLHALDLARAAQDWADATGCLQGLRILYQRTGRDGEWARLVEQVTPEFIDPATGGPLPGREDQWSLITSYRVRLARAARDWPAATRLQHTLITWDRDRAAAALALPGGKLTPSSAARSAPSASPWKTSATSSASKTIRAACPTTRKPSPCASGSAPAPTKPTWRTPSAIPTRTSPACGTWARPSAGISTASPTGPTVTPLAAPKPWEAWATWPTSGSAKPAPPGNPGRCSWPTSTPPWTGTSRPWPSSPPMTPKTSPPPITSSASSTTRRGTPGRPCATTSNPSPTRRPAATPTAPGRPATTSPSSSRMLAAAPTRYCTPAPP